MKTKIYYRHELNAFTIVELLIVIVVIGILAALVISTYSGVQGRAYDASVQNDINSMAKQIEVMAADSGDYPVPTSANKIAIDKSAYDKSNNNLYYCRNNSTHQFAISAQSKSGKQFKYVSGGSISTNPARMYAADTCSLIGMTYSGADGTFGYQFNGDSWAGWIK